MPSSFPPHPMKRFLLQISKIDYLNYKVWKYIKLKQTISEHYASIILILMKVMSYTISSSNKLTYTKHCYTKIDPKMVTHLLMMKLLMNQSNSTKRIPTSPIQSNCVLLLSEIWKQKNQYSRQELHSLMNTEITVRTIILRNSRPVPTNPSKRRISSV